jgi:predicted nucleic acid-binding Zn ribbon protein
MPVYVYRRSDGSTFELAQPITAEPLATCPTTAQGVARILQPFSAPYTGTGLYATDHPQAPRALESAPATETEP